jgi:hypothetical protein
MRQKGSPAAPHHGRSEGPASGEPTRSFHGLPDYFTTRQAIVGGGHYVKSRPQNTQNG